MKEEPKIGVAALAALFTIGAVGGLIGDMCHVVSGTTVYLEDPLPYIWKSQLWFPLMVGGGTAALGWIAVALGARAAEPKLDDPRRETAAMIASVLGLYALTAIVRGEPSAVGIVLCYSVAGLICSRFARDRVDWLCAGLAAIFGVGTEMVLSAVGVFEYAGDIEQIIGVAAWLPALYLAYGVVAARLGVLLSGQGGVSR